MYSSKDIFDVFISFKNDGEGKYFAEKISNALKEQGFSVYYNPHEQKAGSFPTILRDTIKNCRDFLLVLSQACLDQLMRHEKVDWVREEIIIAQKNGKNIVPILTPGVTMPKDNDDMPKDLKFLPHENAINVSDPFDKSPLDQVLSYIKSRPNNAEKFKDMYQSNEQCDIREEFKLLEEKAKSGNFPAMFELATFHMFHLGEINNEQAFYWYNRVLDTNDEELKTHALNRIAHMYFSGTVPGEEQSFEKAFEIREEAGKYNSDAAMTNAAMRKLGSGCKFDYQSICDSFKKIPKRDSMSVGEQADFYLTYGKFNEAIELYKEIQGKVPSASYQLGLLYKLGVHTEPPEPDCFRAEHCFLRAVEKGHIEAAYELGMLYYNPPLGEFEKDFEQAVKYFKIAADAGISEAQYKLGWMYRFGLGCNVDISESIKYEEMAANQGHPAGAAQLASLYQINGYINYQKAYKYAKQAADSGYSHGAYMCGNFLFWGRGCEADKKEALKYYKYADQHGSYEAKLMIKKIEKI